MQFGVEDLPDVKKAILSVIFCMICEDFGFYVTHKIFHWPVIYPYFHKIHHDHVTTFVLASEHTHPLEFVLGSLVPGTLGYLILGSKMHFWTLLIWTAVRIGETNDGHGGYEFPFSPYRLIPFMSPAKYHDFHHSNNQGNYAT